MREGIEPPEDDVSGTPEFEELGLDIPYALPDNLREIAQAVAYRHRGRVNGCDHYPNNRAAVMHVSLWIWPKGEPWSAAEKDAFRQELLAALDLAHGHPWLDTEAIVSYLEAEKALKNAGMVNYAAMFAELRQKPRSVWGPYIDEIKNNLPKGGADLTVKIAAAALADLAKKALLGS